MSGMQYVSRPSFGVEESAAISRILDSRWVGQGPATEQFEKQVAAYIDAKHVVATASCTSALTLALGVLELQQGDEVLVPSMTFAATVQAIVNAGGTPVFCEVQESTMSIDAQDAAMRVTSRTRAMVPVHFAGAACEMEALQTLASQQGLRVIEDAAHAFGSAWRGRKIGSFGDLTCFSFSATKNITCGEGGAIATSDEAIAALLRTRRFLGIQEDTWKRNSQPRNWEMVVSDRGIRAHMNDLHAAIGLAQLEKAHTFTARRRAITRRYDQELAGIDGLEPLERDLENAVPHIHVVRVTDGRRDLLIEHLRQKHIGATVHYVPNHFHPAFASSRVSLPVTERLYQQVVTLPLHCELDDEDVTRVILEVRQFMNSSVKVSKQAPLEI